jgi:hypothetical protein
LFIIDVAHIPEGQTTWPAFWSFGPNWPNSGEIDVIEGVNDQSYDSITLHTSAGCTMNDVVPATSMTGTYPSSGSLDCDSNNGNNGCTTSGPIGSFATQLNQNGGGAFASLWTDQGISIFYWPRASIPPDVTAKQPRPDGWGLPVSFFLIGQGTDCPATHFASHNLVVNTTLCGAWAGSVYAGGAGGANACNDFVVSSGSSFADAYWAINAIDAYSLP